MRRPEPAIQSLNSNHRIVVEASQIPVVVSTRDVQLDCALPAREQRDLELKVHSVGDGLVRRNRVQARQTVERAFDPREWNGAAAWAGQHPSASLLSNDDAPDVGRDADGRQIGANLRVQRDGRRTCWAPETGAVSGAVRMRIRLLPIRRRGRSANGSRSRGFLGVAARERRARES